MGNEIGFIKIANLEGTTKALATAADLDQDGKVEAGELAVFNRLVGEAGLNQDQGLVVEREKLDERGTKEATPKELAKQEDKMYKECFGFKPGSADLANFKAQIAAYDSRVIAVFKQLKEAGDMETMIKLNEQIANRPDMTNYMGNSAGYLAQLDKYADAAEALLQKSDRQYQADLAGGLHQHIDNNTGILAGITLAIGDDLKANMDENTAVILKGIQDGTAKVIDQIKDTEGNIKQTVRSAEGHICQVVRNSEGRIIRVVRQEGAHTRAAVSAEGAHTRAEVRNEGAHTRATVRNEGADTRGTVRAEGAHTRAEVHAEADRVIDTLDPTHLRRAAAWVRDQAANADQTVFEFIQANPGMAVGAAAGLPAGAAGVPLGALAGHLIFD